MIEWQLIKWYFLRHRKHHSATLVFSCAMSVIVVCVILTNDLGNRCVLWLTITSKFPYKFSWTSNILLTWSCKHLAKDFNVGRWCHNLAVCAVTTRAWFVVHCQTFDAAFQWLQHNILVASNFSPGPVAAANTRPSNKDLW